MPNANLFVLVLAQHCLCRCRPFSLFPRFHLLTDVLLRRSSSWVLDPVSWALGLRFPHFLFLHLCFLPSLPPHTLAVVPVMSDANLLVLVLAQHCLCRCRSFSLFPRFRLLADVLLRRSPSWVLGPVSRALGLRFQYFLFLRLCFLPLLLPRSLAVVLAALELAPRSLFRPLQYLPSLHPLTLAVDSLGPTSSLLGPLFCCTPLAMFVRTSPMALPDSVALSWVGVPTLLLVPVPSPSR